MTSDKTLAREVAAAAGSSALPILHRALEHCHGSRYTLRSRTQQLFGDFAESWQALHAAIRHAKSTLKHSSRSPSRSYELDTELRDAKLLSHRAVTLLANCVPNGSSSRTKELADRFLENVARHPETGALGAAMQTAAAGLELGSASSLRGSRHRSSGKGHHRSSSSPYDEGYEYAYASPFSGRVSPPSAFADYPPPSRGALYGEPPVLVVTASPRGSYELEASRALYSEPKVLDEAYLAPRLVRYGY